MRQSLHAVAAVAAVALVVFAGCSSVPTPSPGPDAPTTERPEYPPGVTDDSLEDWRALVDAHRESVRERGAVVTSNTTVEAPIDGEVRTADLSETARAGPDGGPVYVDSRRPRVEPNGSLTRVRVQRYADRETFANRVVVAGNETVERESRDRLAAVRDRHVARVQQLQRVLSAAAFEVASVEVRDGRWVTTLVANEASLADDEDDDEGEFSAAVEVAASGRVLSLTLTRDPYPDQRAGYEQKRVTWANGTTVEAPEWAQ